MIKIVFTIIINCFFTLNAFAGPFGLHFGMSKKQLETATGGNFKSNGVEGLYKSISVPLPNSSFEMYTFVITEKHGLCKITAVGKNIQTNSFGNQVISEFQAIETALIKKYGKNKNFNYLKSGSIWKDSNDWMMGLLKEERELVSFWDEEESGHKLVDGINAIQLKAHALNSGTGFLKLVYESTAYTDCAESIRSVSNSSL